MESTEVVSKGGKQQIKTTTVDTNDASSESRMIVVDLGKKQSKKKIRRLRQGQGPLLDDVKALVERTKENLGVKENILPIVIVVQKKRNNRLLW
jgi:hypothetical protein